MTPFGLTHSSLVPKAQAAGRGVINLNPDEKVFHHMDENFRMCDFRIGSLWTGFLDGDGSVMPSVLLADTRNTDMT